jgi:hypothetical protein
MNKQQATIAVAIGAIVSVTLQLVERGLGAFVMSCCSTEQGGSAIGFHVLYLVNALVALMPGFVTGWLARRRGMLLGFLAGAIGSILFSAFPRFLSSVLAAGDASLMIDFASATFFSACTSGLFAGAAGGTAELLRANAPAEPVKPEAARPLRYGLLTIGVLGIASAWIGWWLFEMLSPPSYGEMSAGHSLISYFLLAAANVVFIVIALIGLVTTVRSYMNQ